MSSLLSIAGFVTFVGLPQVLRYTFTYNTSKIALKYYSKLKKPFWAPPASTIKLLWTVLYTLLGFASYLVWRQKVINNRNVEIPLFFYGFQLLLNLSWAPLFFRIQSPILALICIGLNLATTVLATMAYYIIEPISVKFMIPYLVTLVFLVYLSNSIWDLNQLKIKSFKNKSKKSNRNKATTESSETEPEDE